MSAYCLFDVREETDPEKLQDYREKVTATVTRHGGRYVVIGGPVDVKEGNWRPVFPVIIEFPSMAAAERWYGSEEYQVLKSLRQAAARGDAVFIRGLISA
jgi:uncharacterized protein (DUF1330 family)